MRNSKYTKDGKRKGYYRSITGRVYVFEEQPRPEIKNEWMKKKLDKEDKPNYSPTQMKNFPVQGISTGDIVPLVLGKVHRVLFESKLSPNYCLLINTVHDSILVDCEREYADLVAETLKTTMEEVPQYLKQYFNIETDLPFEVTVNVADSWAGTK